MTQRKAQALAARLLKASGFVDLETPDGMLSNKGRFGGRRDDDATRLAEGERYTRWATSVLWHGHFPRAFDRAAWALHAEGVSREDSVSLLAGRWPGVTEYQIQVSTTATRDRHIGRGKGNEGRKPVKLRSDVFRRLLSRVATDTLVSIAKVVTRLEVVNRGN